MIQRPLHGDVDMVLISDDFPQRTLECGQRLLCFVFLPERILESSHLTEALQEKKK